MRPLRVSFIFHYRNMKSNLFYACCLSFTKSVRSQGKLYIYIYIYNNNVFFLVKELKISCSSICSEILSEKASK